MPENPFVSIIMPSFNSERTIKESLASIRKQDYSQNRIEILVIDGGSTDKTKTIAESLSCQYWTV